MTGHKKSRKIQPAIAKVPLFGFLLRDDLLMSWPSPPYFRKDFSLCFLLQRNM